MKSNTQGTVAPTLDALLSFDIIATQVFAPSRGRSVGITRTGLAMKIKRGKFPKPIHADGKGRGKPIYWRKSDIVAWLNSRSAA